jgi:hypothetical protein
LLAKQDISCCLYKLMLHGTDAGEEAKLSPIIQKKGYIDKARARDQSTTNERRKDARKS